MSLEVSVTDEVSLTLVSVTVGRVQDPEVSVTEGQGSFGQCHWSVFLVYCHSGSGEGVLRVTGAPWSRVPRVRVTQVRVNKSGFFVTAPAPPRRHPASL